MATESKYKQDLEKAQKALAGYGTFTYDKEAPQYDSRWGDKIDSAIKSVGDYKPFEFKEAPIYQNAYEKQTGEALNGILNYAPFSYDASEDPVFQAYKKQYLREGDRATQNVIGQAAAVNGGALSTAGVSAAAQAGNYYAGQLADKIPALYESAYNRYLNEFNRQLQTLGALNSQEQLEYGKYRDERGDYETDRQFAYGAWGDEYNRRLKELGILQDQESVEYGRYRDEVGDYQNQRQFEYSLWGDGYNLLQDQLEMYRDAENTEYTRGVNEENTQYTRRINEEETQRQSERQAKQDALSLWQTLGYATPEIAALLGVPEGTLTSDQKYNNKKLELEAEKQKDKEEEEPDEETNVDEEEELPTLDLSGIMTPKEWSRRKNTGYKGSSMSYDSYDEYKHYATGDVLYTTIMNNRNVTESQVRTLCKNAGFPYDALEFCVANDILPSQFNRQAVG